MAVQVCVGLTNRDITRRAHYVNWGETSEDYDARWLNDALGIGEGDYEMVDVRTYLAQCIASNVGKGRLRYDFTQQLEIVPNLLTIAAVLDVIPLEDDDPLAASLPVVFDALVELKGATELIATNYVFERYANRTTGLCKMNPGWDTHDTHHILNPPLTGHPNLLLADFIVSARLFNFFLKFGCLPLSKEHALMGRIAASEVWPNPKLVWGYDNTFAVAGDLFEAETTCVMQQRDMGQVASSGVSNLAFWSRSGAIEAPLPQVPLPKVPDFDASLSYLSLVVGDGDSIEELRGGRANWMKERVAHCTKRGEKGCYPLLWSLSPHLARIAPDWLRWFFKMGAQTGADWFVLPPSGDLYAYPGLMPADSQEAFVANTERDCEILNTSATVAWEFVGTWRHAVKNYFPRYGERGVVTAIFPVNVPYMLPMAAFWRSGNDFKIFGGRTVLFKPREWRGTGDPQDPFSARNFLSVADMAKELNTAPRGTISHIYLTSDGGASLDTLNQLVDSLDDHVRVVDHRALAALALQRGERTSAS